MGRRTGDKTEWTWPETRPGFQLPRVIRTESASLLLMASMSVVSTSSAVPPWALAAIVLVSGLLVFGCCFCVYRKRCRRRLGKKSQAQAQVHLQEVKELGRSYIDKVWPGPAPRPYPVLHRWPSSLSPRFLPSHAHLTGSSLWVFSPDLDPGDLEIGWIESLFLRTTLVVKSDPHTDIHNTGWYVPHDGSTQSVCGYRETTDSLDSPRMLPSRDIFCAETQITIRVCPGQRGGHCSSRSGIQTLRHFTIAGAQMANRLPSRVGV